MSRGRPKQQRLDLARTSYHAALIVAGHDAVVPGLTAEAYHLEEGALSRAR